LEEDGPFLDRVRRFESGLLEAALAQNGFNQRRAAAALGMGYHQFRHYLKKHGTLRRPAAETERP
jgi:psp operon transcriptional activator